MHRSSDRTTRETVSSFPPCIYESVTLWCVCSLVLGIRLHKSGTSHSILICLTVAFSIILSRLTQGAANGKRPLSFLAEYHCTAYGHHIFLTHPSVDTGCCHDLAGLHIITRCCEKKLCERKSLRDTSVDRAAPIFSN